MFSGLCRELSRQATPALLAAGFSAPPHEFGRDETNYDFKRDAPDGRHVLSIMFDKYRNPHFSVQLHVEPKLGIKHMIESGGVLLVGYLSASYRPWPLDLALFSAEPSLWQRIIGRNTAQGASAVGAFLRLMPEVEAWWKTQRSSRHILTGRTVYPGMQRAA